MRSRNVDLRAESSGETLPLECTLSHFKLIVQALAIAASRVSVIMIGVPVGSEQGEAN